MNADVLVRAIAAELAGPRPDEDPLLFETLSYRLLDRVRAGIASAAGVCGFDQDVVESIARFSDPERHAWRPELGLAMRHLAAGDWMAASLQWAFAAAAAGAIGAVTVDAASQSPPMLLDGIWVPVDGPTRLEASSDGIELQTQAGLRRFVWRESRWTSVGDPSGVAIGADRSIAFEGGPYVISLDRVMPSGGRFPWASTERSPPAPTTPVPDALTEGMRWIDQNSPEHARWISLAVQGLLVVHPGPMAPATSSDPNAPGWVAIAPPQCPVACAELLVQEAARQFIRAYSAAAAFTVPGSTETWYSPLSRQYMPTLRVLRDAHVATNLATLFARARSDERVRSRALQVRVLLELQCRPVLEKSRCLTDAGQALWRALDAALVHAAS